MASLELQRFCLLLKFHITELRAKFLVGVCAFTHGYSSQAPQPALPPTGTAARPRPWVPRAHHTGISTGAFLV